MAAHAVLGAANHDHEAAPIRPRRLVHDAEQGVAGALHAYGDLVRHAASRSNKRTVAAMSSGATMGSDKVKSCKVQKGSPTTDAGAARPPPSRHRSIARRLAGASGRSGSATSSSQSSPGRRTARFDRFARRRWRLQARGRPRSPQLLWRCPPPAPHAGPWSFRPRRHRPCRRRHACARTG